MKNFLRPRTGLRLKNIIIIETVIISLLCVLMVFNIVNINNYNKQSIELSKRHIKYTDITLQLNLGSDILTEQVRLFSVTGQKEYLDGYFNEADVARHRDVALEMLNKLPDADKKGMVGKAMDESMRLMNREYYSMRLTALGYGIPEETLPSEIRNFSVPEADRKLSSEELKEKARSMLFDDIYLGAKQKIKSNINNFLTEMIAESDIEYNNLSKKIRIRSDLQTAIAVVVFAVIILMTLFLYFFVIRPIVAAAESIGKDMPVNMPRFVEELNLMGLSYNDLHARNSELMERLNIIAKKDVLTDMGNRFAYHNYCSSVTRENKRIIMFLFDVNNLRVTNNKEGHAAGDRLLMNTAKCIITVFGREDHANCFRIGGDEFAAFIEDEPESNAGGYLTAFEEETEKCGISVSVGYSFAENPRDVSIKRLFKAADEMMYKNKYA